MIVNYKLLNRIIAAVVFLISVFVLFSTVQPSVSFWDCGEFTAAAYYLQVPHPPGAPFFTILGRIFSLIPFAANIAYRVNVISVLSSALSILFLYLIAVKLIENYRGKTPQNLFDALGTYIAAAIGALSFSFSDTFWFNGVEAEVYATSTFLFAAITYLMILWNEKADNKDNEKYILMIAYLIGISTGVHLMSVLAIVSVTMMILFRKYVQDEEALLKSTYIFVGHAVVVLIIAFAMWGAQTNTTPPTSEQYLAFDFRFKMIMVGISILIMSMFWKKIFNRNSIYIPLIIGGAALFLTYPGIVKILPGIMTSISGDNAFAAMIILLLIFAGLGYGVYYSVKEKKPTLNLVFMSFIFILLGFTTYTMVIIRSNENPPMNENEPNDFSELVSYLNREQYGDFPIFKRRFSQEAHQRDIYTNYSSDLDFFWTYQMNHMMTRYLLWNYAGRESWNQDAGSDVSPFNKVANYIAKPFGIHFSGDSKDSLFAIPFLLGLIGIYFHLKKDWKMAIIFMVLFIFMGYLTAFYQNQQQPQPRERDYFYVGAFFVFSIWIAFGIRGFVDIMQSKIKNISVQNTAVTAILLIGIILVPVKMISANYFKHDRSKNWFPWDYSYNLLQSCPPNSVLFTNGDNDTFPLWYLQDVEGVRRDVKIANLSLLNTPWYIKQLKSNDPYHVGTVKMNLSDAQIESLMPIQWEPRDITIPIKPTLNESISDIVQKYNITDSSAIKAGGITFKMNNSISFGTVKAIRVQDIMVKEIVEANNWQRPICFAVTCSEDSKIGLDDYLKMEGMVFVLVPQKRIPGVEFLDPNILKQQLFNENSGYSKSYKPGFKFRGLNNPDIFFDENHRRMTMNYRNAFFRLGIYYINTNNDSMAIKTLNIMEEKMPRRVIPMNYMILAQLGNLYFHAGDTDEFKKISVDIEKEAWKAFNDNPADITSVRVLLDTYQNLKAYGKLVNLWQKIETMYPNDPEVKANIEKYKKLAAASDSSAKAGK